jgi:hypothetical protein
MPEKCASLKTVCQELQDFHSHMFPFLGFKLQGGVVPVLPLVVWPMLRSQAEPWHDCQSSFSSSTYLVGIKVLNIDMFTFVAQNVCAVYQQMSLSVQLNATFVSVALVFICSFAKQDESNGIEGVQNLACGICGLCTGSDRVRCMGLQKRS